MTMARRDFDGDLKSAGGRLGLVPLRFLKLLIRRVSTVRMPGVYIDFFVYIAAQELGFAKGFVPG